MVYAHGLRSTKNKILAFLRGSSSASRVAPVVEQLEPGDMEIIDEMIRAEMGPLNGELVASVTPGEPIAPEIYRVIIEEPINHSEVVAPVNNCAGAESVSPQDSNEPYVEIVEQPTKIRRFRYKSEITSAGAIYGVKSKNGQKSFPKIMIGNYVGSAEITISVVYEDKPLVHPYGVICKPSPGEALKPSYICKQVRVERENCIFQFSDLAIVVVTVKQIKEAMQLKAAEGVDPFKKGFSHKPTIEDLKGVRLCFHVKLTSLERELQPVVSDVIKDSKKLGSVDIMKMSICTSSVMGGPEIIFLSRNLKPKDLEIIFYEEINGQVLWEKCISNFESYGGGAIVCMVPAYTRATIISGTDINVSVKLRRTSDGTCGEPLPFTYYADNTDFNKKKRKVMNSLLQQYAREN